MNSSHLFLFLEYMCNINVVLKTDIPDIHIQRCFSANRTFWYVTYVHIDMCVLKSEGMSNQVLSWNHTFLCTWLEMFVLESNIMVCIEMFFLKSEWMFNRVLSSIQAFSHTQIEMCVLESNILVCIQMFFLNSEGMSNRVSCEGSSAMRQTIPKPTNTSPSKRHL